MKEGFISSINAEKIGVASVILGAGRETKDSDIDFPSGIITKVKPADFIKLGDVVAVLYSNKESGFKAVEDMILESLEIDVAPPVLKKLIVGRVDKHSSVLY